MMNFDELEKRYDQLLHEAMELDENAIYIQKQGKYKQAAQEYARASALYAKAASVLVEISDQYGPADRAEVQKSVDRLIQISRQLKETAAALETAPPPAPGEAPKTSPLPTQDDEDRVTFAAASKASVTFDDIAGLDHAKQLIMDEIINPLLHKELYERFHIESNGGLLLFGPPGGGKTMMARAVAAQANMAFFSVKCSDIVGKYFGEAEKHVQALFNAAREAKNAVIFMDEAEALACRRGGNSTVMNRLVPELLSQMDGFEKFDGHIIVIFATNRPYDLDPAFLRPGRLPNHCYIPLPDLEVRRTFLKKLVDERPCQGMVDIETLAQRTDRFSCADLVNLVKRSCQRPINRSIRRKLAGESTPEEFLTQADLNNALLHLHPSVEPEEIARLEKWMKKIGMAYPASGTPAA